MYRTRCVCGNQLDAPARVIGRAAACDRCRKVLRFVAASPASGEAFTSRLIVQAGPAHVDEAILLGGTGAIDVGKQPERTLTLPGPRVSRRHCRLAPDHEGGWVLEDTHSTNGVFVNQQAVSRHALQDGDVVRLGGYQLLFQNHPHQAAGLEAATARGGRDDLPAPATGDAAEEDEDEDESWLYDLIAPEPDTIETPVASGAAAAATMPAVDEATWGAGGVGGRAAVRPPATGGPPCPSCEKSLSPGAKVCVKCGVKVPSGRPVITAHAVNENKLYENALGVVRVLSWVVPTTVTPIPVASEAYGRFKPYAIWSIFGLTVAASMAFLIGEWTSSGPLPPHSELMLWFGDAHAPVRTLGQAVRAARYANTDVAQFHWYQLITHAFLHGGIMHLAGNMLFLLVFGTRVNALIGNLKTAVLYPLLAVVAALAFMASVRHHLPGPMLGASGAIMGLAGMYFVLFPLHRVFLMIWLRLGLLTAFKLFWKIWAVRGFWVVLFYIAFDVAATLLGAQDGVAHWAHLGGFLAGMTVGVLLLLSRQIDARGADLLSVVLGRYAWPLIGRPAARRSAPAA